MSNYTNFTSETEWGYLPGVDPSVHYIMGVVLAVIGTVGVLGNLLVLVVFLRFRKLRGPFSAFIVNLAVADLCTSLLHSMAAVSSFSRRWVFGEIGCQLYAGGVGHFGLLSIVTMAAIAVERYMVITSKPLSKSWKITQYDSRMVCTLAWLYCLAMSAPPLLGWSRYELEGLHTSCSWDYTTRSTSNRAYYLYLLILGFVVPVTIILYCYAFIMAVILAHGRGISSVKNEAVTLQPNVASRDHMPDTGHPLSTSFRTAEIILVLVILFLVSWTPYAVVTFIAQFGDQRLVTPWVAALPAIFAKASVVYNPIVYGLSHPHFRSVVRRLVLHCTLAGSVSTMGPSLLSMRGARLERAAASSPGTTRKQPNPQAGGVQRRASIAVEPDYLTGTASRSRAMEVTWHSATGNVKCALAANHLKIHRTHKKKRSTAVISEGMETIGTASVAPQSDLAESKNTRDDREGREKCDAGEDCSEQDKLKQSPELKN